MKRVPIQGVQPAVLRWARESLELSITSVAQHLKCEPDRVESWEAGDDAPTYSELENLAYSLYKRPLAVFFLPTPPSEAQVQREFRTLPKADLEQLLPDTILHLRKAKSYQIGISKIFGERNTAKALLWKEIRLSLDADLVEQARRVREVLGLTLDGQSRWKTDDNALKEWRTALESVGLFIFKAAFRQKEISGFCLPDDEFPLIYLNNSTTKTRQIFSLMHEVGHVLLNLKGLSRLDSEYINDLPNDMARIERFCNAFAAELLMPIDDFQSQTRSWPTNVDQVADSQLESLAARYGVSREAVLRRFLDQGRVTKETYEQKAQLWTAQMKKGGRGNYYSTQNTYLSLRFAQEVVTQHYRNSLTMEEASDFLGIPPKNFEGLEHLILQGSAS